MATRTAASENVKKSVERVEVKLVKHHTHAGELKAPGDKIKVRPRQVSWLQKRGIVEKSAQ